MPDLFSGVDSPATYNLQLVAGDGRVRRFLLKKPDGTAFDLTGWSVVAHIRNKPRGTLILAPAVSIADAVNGTIELTITTTQSLAIPTGAYWDLQVSLDASPTTNTQTLLRGRVTVLTDHTVL